MADYSLFRRLFQDPRHAAIYDRTRFGGLLQRWNNRVWLRAVRRCLAHARPEGAVLDLPCGTGRLARLFREMGIRQVGADLSLAMLALARSKGCGPLVVADAERLPLRDGAVDGIVSLRFLHHPLGPSRSRILAEMARVARRFVVVDLRYRNRAREALRTVERLYRRGRERKRYPRLDEVREEIAGAGFAVARIVRLPRLLSDNCLLLAFKRSADTESGQKAAASSGPAASARGAGYGGHS
jgi:ubiquinone/menaquinone biosynthesis C-methylase UbiE